MHGTSSIATARPAQPTRHWAFALLGLLALSCDARAHRPSVDSQSHWLEKCKDDSDCGELSCLCGVCSSVCASSAECGTRAKCATPSKAQGACAALASDEQICVAACSGGACTNGNAPADMRSQSPAAGGPDASTGSMAADTVSAVDDANAAAGMCLGKNLPVAADQFGRTPADCMIVDLVTDGPPGDYDSKGSRANNGVIWIEDDKGNYATGLEAWAVKWPLQGASEFLITKERLYCSDPDVVGTATRQQHVAHHLIWRCQDTGGNVVPDGNYTLWVEVQVDDKHRQPAVSFPFTKGPTAWNKEFPSTPATKSVALAYTPIE